ncbi:MAG: TusE/DsrC/DsvC family sulfur relay protein [Gammaproteobacteria bacterium]|nr:TusE/DsrC/DsvC family sulfur relay protein [Gammaproteobacteria bacterium]
MNNLEIEGNIIELRADGRLQNSADWTPELALELASNEGLTLTDEHWDVINTMRDYYNDFNTSPILKLLRRELSKEYGVERATEGALIALFPGGVQHQGSRIAGIPLAYLDAELDEASRIKPVQPGKHSTGHFNDVFDFNGKSITVYTSGNLVNLEDWNEEMAGVLAEKEGIQLTDEHWVVINFLRKFYFQYGVAPMVKILIKHMTDELGATIVNKERMYELFPGGPAKQGSRIAGLPFPQGCIDD